MKLLHNRNLLDCSEFEEAIYQAETEKIAEVIATLPDYDCDVIIIYENSYHKEKYPPLRVNVLQEY